MVAIGDIGGITLLMVKFSVQHVATRGGARILFWEGSILVKEKPSTHNKL